MNGYRPIVELMNTNFGIYGMAEISSAGNTYATTGGQFIMPMTIIGAGTNSILLFDILLFSLSMSSLSLHHDFDHH